MRALRSLYAAAFTPPHRRVVLRAAHEACVAAAVAMDSHDEAAIKACEIDWPAQQEHAARVSAELGGTAVVELPVKINGQKAPQPEEARLEE